MISIVESTWEKIMQLNDEQIPLVNSYIDDILKNNQVTSIPKRRLGVASQISFPANFDDIDYGTEELFGL